MYEKEVAEGIRELVDRTTLEDQPEQFDGVAFLTETPPSENGCFSMEFETGAKFIVIIQQVSE